MNNFVATYWQWMRFNKIFKENIGGLFEIDKVTAKKTKKQVYKLFD